MISFIQFALICLLNENLESIFTPSSFFSSDTLVLSIRDSPIHIFIGSFVLRII